MCEIKDKEMKYELITSSQKVSDDVARPSDKKRENHKIVSTVVVYHVPNSALFEPLCGTSQ